MTTPNQDKAAAQKVAGKAANAYSATKGWIAKQYAKPTVKLLIGAALGAAATIGAKKGQTMYQSRRGHATSM